MEFRDYTSFLEIAFAVNIALAAWDGAYFNWFDRKRQLFRKLFEGNWFKTLKLVKRSCRTVAFLVAIAIAVALLCVPPETEIVRPSNQFLLIAASGFVPAYLAFLMGFVLLFIINVVFRYSTSILSKWSSQSGE